MTAIGLSAPPRPSIRVSRAGGSIARSNAVLNLLANGAVRRGI